MKYSWLAALLAGVVVAAPSASRFGVITGRVVRAADGSPVAGAKLYMKQTPPTTTDSDGRFEIRHQHVGYRSLWVVASGLAVDREKILVTGKPRVAGVEFRLKPSLQVHGRALDDQGKPVSGARVYAFSLEWTESETRTDTEGRFELDTLYHPGYPSVMIEADGFAPAILEDPPADVGDVKMERMLTGRLEGRVVGVGGRTLEGAHVYLQPRAHDAYQQSAVANSRGMFRFVVAPGTYDIYAISSDANEASVLRGASVASTQTTNVIVSHQDWVEMTGQLAPDLPGAADHAEVAAYPTDFGSRVYYMFTDSNPVDASGGYALRRLLPGRYVIRVYKPPGVDNPEWEERLTVTEQMKPILLGRKASPALK